MLLQKDAMARGGGLARTAAPVLPFDPDGPIMKKSQTRTSLNEHSSAAFPRLVNQQLSAAQGLSHRNRIINAIGITVLTL